MKISVFAVGRMKAGPEKELADRYFDRFSKSGRAIGLEFSGLAETPESRAQSAAERKREEADRLKQHLAAGAALILLDERGKNLSSKTCQPHRRASRRRQACDGDRHRRA